VKVLVVDPDTSRVPALQQALAAGGAEVSIAPSGSFALTMLEWHRQDVIVSQAHLGDMDAHELCAIVKSDPATRDVRFVLVGRPDEITPAQAAASGIDLVIPRNMSGSTIVTLVVQLMLRVGARPTDAPLPTTGVPSAAPVAMIAAAPIGASAAVGARAPVARPAPPAPAAGADGSKRGPNIAALGTAGAKTFQGSLGALAMEELTQAIGMGGKTGRLLLVLSAGGGLIAFEAGRVVHAEFGATTGEAAFEALVAASHKEHSGKFCFIPGEVPANTPRTMDRTVDQLLLSIATTIDERGR
jgi:CheY-like chemotaxis protein